MNSRERQLIAHLEKSRQQVDSSVQQQRSIIQKLKRSPKQPSFEDISRLKSDQALLDSLLEVKFAVHGDKALKAVEKLGSGFLPATNAEPVHCHPQPTVVYHTNGTTHTPPSNQQQEPTKAAHPTQPQQPEHNGRPDNKHVNGTDIKHSVSHSSLASEENDSGLGQISPVSQGESLSYGFHIILLSFQRRTPSRLPTGGSCFRLMGWTPINWPSWRHRSPKPSKPRELTTASWPALQAVVRWPRLVDVKISRNVERRTENLLQTTRTTKRLLGRQLSPRAFSATCWLIVIRELLSLPF